MSNEISKEVLFRVIREKGDSNSISDILNRAKTYLISLKKYLYDQEKDGLL